jgi:hypothetical protein
MKHLLFILSLVGLVACNTEKWGYKTNPDYVLSEAYQAIKGQNTTKWLSVSTGNAYCKYATAKALKHLDNEVLSKADLNKLKTTLSSQVSLQEPEYETFWVFHKKSYKSEIVEKYNGRVLATLNITCFYGANENVFANKNRPVSMYPKKYCAISKIDFKSARDFDDNGDCDE